MRIERKPDQRSRFPASGDDRHLGQPLPVGRQGDDPLSSYHEWSIGLNVPGCHCQRNPAAGCRLAAMSPAELDGGPADADNVIQAAREKLGLELKRARREMPVLAVETRPVP